MTRRDYLMITEAMRKARPPENVPMLHRQWERDCNTIAAELKQDNPAFDVLMFISGCKGIV